MTTAPFIANVYSDWWTVSVLAAAISVLISIMLILLSRAFDLRNLEQNAKAEFVFAASTVFIVLFTVGLITTAEGTDGHGVIVEIGKRMYLDTVTYCPDMSLELCQNLSRVNYTGIKVNTTIDIMLLYMDPPAKCSQQFLEFLYYASIPIEACASIYMEIFMSEQMTCFGLKWLAERITNTTQMLAFYMFVYYLLGHMMMFIKYYAGFFFSMGVVLRAFPPTRGAGAYLMAITVGLYFVFPFSYIMVSTMSLTYAQSSVFSATGVDSASGSPTYGSIQYTCGIPQLGDVEGLQCGTGSFSKVFELLGWLDANRSQLQDFVTINIPGLLRHLSTVICVFPLVSFVILFTFILNTTGLFGGNIPEIGRGLVRLI